MITKQEIVAMPDEDRRRIAWFVLNNWNLSAEYADDEGTEDAIYRLRRVFGPEPEDLRYGRKA